MSFVSYAQNFEDVMLWRALSHIERGFYIDVGAAWPDEDSVTRAFYDRGWTGINVEPNPQFFSQLQERRPNDINLLFAVGEREEMLAMNFVSGSGLSTLSEEVAQTLHEKGWNCDRQMVSVTRLSLIIEKHVSRGQEVHFLKVDVEGFEKFALQGMNWELCRPWIVVVESMSPSTQIEAHEAWEPILVSEGYQFAYADGINRFYVSRDHLNLLQAFKYPPNVFDEFKVHAQARMEVALTEASAKVKFAHTQIRELQKLNLDLRSQLKDAELRVESLEGLSRDLKQSWSWRLTAPLRFVLGVFSHRKETVQKFKNEWSRGPLARKAGSPRAGIGLKQAAGHEQGLGDLTPRAFRIFSELKKKIEESRKDN